MRWTAEYIYIYIYIKQNNTGSFVFILELLVDIK